MAGTGPGGRLRDATMRPPHAALGRAVEFLLEAPEFQRIAFGQIARLLIGCIGRGSYMFIVDEGQRIQGFCGWAMVSRDSAEAWLRDNRDLTQQDDARPRDVCAVNLWKAARPEVNSAMIGALRRRLPAGTRLVVARRFYRDGRIRPIRMPVAPHQLRPAAPGGGPGGDAAAGPRPARGQGD
ncbi:MAG: toxin-activating lysine-acyltransferase [Alphaproteobacteria bacterium]|nr:MAG: toxin-activating lysine-acyltransferase [Alphaproteobacteria bacterium]